MIATALPLAGLLLLEPKVFEDERGAFFESFNQRAFEQALGRAVHFVQDNHSVSARNVVRGLHYQIGDAAQGKLVRVVQGSAFDVAVDIRRSSKTFGQWYGVTLSAENRKQMWIPAGFAHGFVALEDSTEFLYKATGYYSGPSERSISWQDEDIGVEWPLTGPAIVSGKDAVAPNLADVDHASLF